MSGWAGRLVFPWQNRKREFSWLKAAAFLLVLAPAIWLLHAFEAGRFGRFAYGGMTYWSGFLAIVYLLLALSVTPMAAIFHWTQLIAVRRMIGVSALVYSIAHLVIYFGLRFWNFSVIAVEMVTRISLIVACVATLGLLVLGATSWDGAIRRLGAARWRYVHTIVYAAAGLAIAHFLLSPSIYSDQYFVSGLYVWLMAWRVMNRYGAGTDSTALFLLAAGACAFTALLEAIWIWVYHGFDPWQTLSFNFDLSIGVSAALQVLMIGVAVASAAAWRKRLGLAQGVRSVR